MGTDVQAVPGVERLRLLASAIGGRPLEVGDAGAGEPAWTDGATVFVDATAGHADQVRAVAVQASLVAAGSLDPAILTQLLRRPGLARRYLAIEAHRALAATEPVLPPAARCLIDPAVLALLPTPTPVVGPAAALEVARKGGVGEGAVWVGVIRVRKALAVFDKGEGTGQGGDDARHTGPVGRGVELERVDEDDEDGGDDEPGDVGNLLESAVGGQGALGRLLQRLLRVAREPGRGSGPAGGDAPTHSGGARRRGSSVVSLAAAPSSGGGDERPARAFGPRTSTYPEWDVHNRRHRPDWCTVRERDPRPQDLAAMPEPTGGHALRRPLARLGAGLDRVRRRPRGDDIDIDAVVEAQVAAHAAHAARAARATAQPTGGGSKRGPEAPDVGGSGPSLVGGGAGPGSVYVESLRRRRDLAVLVLLDISGSAAEPGPGGRTVHEHQRAAAAALATALHDLGDRVALYAFNSQGRTAVHVTRVKEFDDRLDGRVLRRLGGLKPGAYTRLGAAIRHGTTVLEQQGGTSRRLLLVLSDGFAYDHGYGGRYGEADARRALAEARRSGVGCVCLSVGGATPPAALRRVFGSAAHASVPTLDQLPPLVGPLFRAALRTAEAQRRTFQREQRKQSQAKERRRTA